MKPTRDPSVTRRSPVADLGVGCRHRAAGSRATQPAPLPRLGCTLIVILGLVILVAAVIVGVAGVLANGGHAHAVIRRGLAHTFCRLP